MSFDPGSAVADEPAGFDPSTAEFDAESATPEPRRGGTRTEAKPYVPADDGMRPGEAGAGRGRVNPPLALEQPEPAAMPQGPGAALATIRENQQARDQRLTAPQPAPGSRSVFDGAPVQVPEQTGGFTPQEMAEGSVAPWKREEQRRMGEYLAPTNPQEAKPFDTAQNIVQDVREFTDNPVARGAVAGFSQLGQTGIGAVRLAADAAGADGVADFARGASRIATTVGQGATSDLQGGDKLTADIASSIINSGPALAVGALGGPGLATLFAQSTLAEYNAGRDAGFDAAESLGRAGIMGTAEALGERFGFSEQLQLIKAVTKGLPQGELAKVMGAMLVKEIPGEQLTTALQFLADKAGPAALNPNATVADYLNAAGDTLKVTIGQTAVMGGGPAAIVTARNAAAQADAAVERSAMNQAERTAADKGFLRPTQRRKQLADSLDEIAAEQGITESVIAAAKKRAESMPLAEVPGFFKRYAAAVLRRLGRQVDDSALSQLDEPPPPVKEIAPEISREALQPEAPPAPLDVEAAAPEPVAPERALEDNLANRLGIAEPEAAPAPPPPTSTQDLAGQPINRNWTAFTPESGTLNLPREQLPQIKAEHRGALVNFLGARGITHETDAEVDPASLKPTQGEFSPAKVQQAREFVGGDRSILVSADGYVLDGHHQWLAKLDGGQPVKAIRLNAPIQDLLRLAHQFPSSTTARGATRAAPINAGASPQPVTPGDAVAEGGGPAMAPAPSTFRVLTRAGRTPNSTEPIELRPNEDGTLTPFMGGKAMLDFNSGDPIMIPAGASDLDAKKAIRDAGAVSNRTNFYPATKGAAPAPQEATPAAPATLNKPAAIPDSPPKLEQAPAPKPKRTAPVRGSNALGQISARLGGISPDLLADLSDKAQRTRTSKTGAKTQYTAWDNPLHQGHGPLFRKGGSADLSEIARVLEEEGYLAPGSVERDPIAASQRAQEIIRAELKQGGSTLREGDPAAVEAEMERRREAAQDVPDDLLAPLTDSELEQSGYAGASTEVKEAVERLMADAEAAGIDTEALREDAARATEGLTEDEYHARLQAAIREALDAGRQDRGGAAQAEPEAAQRGGEDRGEADGGEGQEAADLIAAFRARFAKPPSGMSTDEFKTFTRERREASDKINADVLALAQKAGSLLLPQKWGSGFIALHADPRTEGAWRITRFTDDMEPSGHMEFSKPAEAAGQFVSDAKAAEPADRPDLELTAPTRAKVLEQQAALEREQEDREAPADQPKDKRTADTPDMFSAQGSVFDQPAEAAAPSTAAEQTERFEAGKALTKEQRRQVIGTLVDVYKAKGAPREMKGQGRDGNERYGYVHSPDLFEKSDITGAMVRYYVTLPDGRRAHPSELFPDYTQSDIEAEMQRRESAEKQDAADQREVERIAEANAADTPAEAEASFKRRNQSFDMRDWRTGKTRTFVHYEKGGKFYAVVSDDDARMQRLERAGWKRADAAAEKPKADRAEQRERLEQIADRLGVKVFKAAGGWHATGDAVDIPDGDVDVVATGAVSANHVFAHELGHVVMQKRGLGFKNFPRAEVERYISNWDEFIAASKEFRPGVHDHENERFRKHAKKPDEIIADAIASVLIGARPVSMLKPMMDKLGITERDLGLADKTATPAAAPQPQPEKAEKQAQEKIDDFGEKIGGARKDTAESGFTKTRRAADDENRPAWARRFKIAQIVKAGGQIGSIKDEGRWVIRDSRSTDWTGQPRQVGRDTFATKEEAEAYVPIAAVSLKHKLSSTRDGKYEIWREVSDRKRVKVVDQQFDTREEAMAYMVKNAVQIIETNTTFGEADIPLPPDRARTGPQRRTGDVKGEDFAKTFGFRGVEFGNWNNQLERQALMNDAFDGMMDLAEVLGVPPKALGLNGDLALAFGARGNGLNSARAHYELERAVINLTKERGAGSLAHEWFHALDHYFGRQDGKASAEWVVQKDGTRMLKVGEPEATMASGGFQRNNSGVRPELRAAYETLLKTMFKKAEAYVEDTAKADKFTAATREELAQQLDALRKELSAQKDPKYYKRNNKPASAELLAEFDTITKALLEGDASATAIELRTIGDLSQPASVRARIANRWTNDSLERLSAIYKEVRGRSGFDSTNQNGVMDRLRGYMTRYSQRLKMLADAQSGTEKTRMVPTDFAMNAKELDQGRGTDYWTTPHEMAARAFQGYVEDKVADQGGMSRFLNYGPENVGIPTPWGFKRPFPAGTERVAINKAFDAFVGEIQTRETDTGVLMFSAVDGSDQAPDTARYAADPDPRHLRIVDFVRESVAERRPGFMLRAVEAPGSRSDLRAARAVARGIAGHKVIFVKQDNGRAFNGAAFGSPGADYLLIDVDSSRPVMAVTGHEMLHRLRGARPDLYAKLDKRISAVLQSESEYAKALRARYEKPNLKPLSDDKIHEELIADIFGDEWNDPDFWRELAKDRPSGFRAIVDAVLKFLDDMIAKVVKQRPFGTEFYLTDMRAARDAVLEATREFSRGEVGPLDAVPSDLQFSAPETDAFRRWFGDSKVVDAEGKPLVVYHGTGNDFDTFMPSDGGEYGAGVYLTPDAKGASSYARYRGRTAPNVMPVYVSIKNPAGPAEASNIASWRGEEAVRPELMRRGYDGIIDKFSGQIVAFRPEQIKSAIGNRGTFDPNDPDIRFSAAAPRPEPPAETTPRAIQRKVQDQFNRFTVIRDWAVEQGLNMTPDSNVWAYEERMHGRIATRVGDFREKTVKPKIQAIQKAGFTMAQVAEYLHAQHAEERNKQIESIDPANTAGSGMTTADAKAILANADPKLAALANDFRKITEDTKAILLKAGIVSKDMTDAWEAAYQNYVPLKGGDEAAQQGTGKGLAANGRQKRALGHGERSEFVVENILRDHERAITVAEKNIVGHSLLTFIADLGREDIATIGQPEKRKVLKNSTDYEVLDGNGARIAIFDSQAGAAAFISKHSQPGLFASIKGPLTANPVRGDPSVAFMATPMLADNEVNVYVKGHAIRVQLNDPLLAQAYTRSGQEGLNQLMAINREINAYLSKVYTGYNPEFLLTNIARDLTTGVINITGKFGAGMAAKSLGNYPKAFASLWRYAMTGKETPDIKAYRDAGGSTGASYLSDIERIGKDVQEAYDEYKGAVATYRDRGALPAARAATNRWLGRFLLAPIRHINEAGENAMRLAVFQAVRDTKGNTVNDAASAAKNVTVNFNRRGEWGQVLGSMYLFFNPAIQGTAAIADSLVNGKNKGQAIALTGSLGVLAYMLAAGQFGGGDDDDEAWAAIPDYVKDKNLIIRTGEKTYITIPIPYGYGFFYALGNATYDLQKGTRDIDKIALKIASNLLEHFSPIGNPMGGDKPEARGLVELIPGAVGGELQRDLVRLMANRNSMGSDIVPDSPFDEGKPDSMKVFRSTKGTIYDKAARAANELTGGTESQAGGISVSPETLKYWTHTVTGGAGAFISDSVGLAGLGARYLYNGADPDKGDLRPEFKEIPIFRRFAKEEGVQDRRRVFWTAAGEVREAQADLTRAKKIHDDAGEGKVWAQRGELVAMGAYMASVSKMVKAQRDLVDEVMADKTTSLAYKRARVRALEKEEQTLYDEFTREFNAEKARAKAERAATP